MTVTIYCKPFCPSCVRAELLLKEENVHFEKIDISINSASRALMLARSNGLATVPQVFIGETHIGGFEALKEAVETGLVAHLLGRPVVITGK